MTSGPCPLPGRLQSLQCWPRAHGSVLVLTLCHLFSEARQDTLLLCPWFMAVPWCLAPGDSPCLGLGVVLAVEDSPHFSSHAVQGPLLEAGPHRHSSCPVPARRRQATPAGRVRGSDQRLDPGAGSRKGRGCAPDPFRSPAGRDTWLTWPRWGKRGRCPRGCAQCLLCPLPAGEALSPLT